MKTNAYKFVSFAIFVLVGCGPSTPAPKTPKDTESQTGLAPVEEAKPKRTVSKEVKKEFEAAIIALKKAGRIKKENCEALAGKFAEIYSDSPKVIEAKFNEGAIWQECGEFDKAESIYKEILSKDQNYGPALNNLGTLYLRKGDIGTARSYFKKAALTKNSWGYSNLAFLQRNEAVNFSDDQEKSKEIEGLLKDAVDNTHRALAVDSNNIDAYATKAILLYDHSKARAQLNMARLICVQAQKMDAKYAPIQVILGLIQLKSDKITPALASFRKAVALDPTLIDAQMNIGAITLSFRDYVSAEKAFSKVLELNSKDQEIRFAATVGLGVAYRGQRKFDLAMTKYQAAKAIKPNSPEVDYNMGILVQDYLFDPSRPEAGIKQLEKAKSFLERYLSSGKIESKLQDVKLRIKNIDELIPMLHEQIKMMKDMQSQQAEAAKAEAEAKVKAEAKPKAAAKEAKSEQPKEASKSPKEK